MTDQDDRMLVAIRKCFDVWKKSVGDEPDDWKTFACGVAVGMMIAGRVDELQKERSQPETAEST